MKSVKKSVSDKTGLIVPYTKLCLANLGLVNT